MAIVRLQPADKKDILVGVGFDAQTRELLNWAIVKVADPGDRVFAVHVCRNSDSILKGTSFLDAYLSDYEVLCKKKQVEIIGQVFKGSSIRKVLVREAKHRAAMAVIVGLTKHHAIGSWTSIAKYCAKKLPMTTEVLAIHNGKVVFSRYSNSELPGFRGDPKPSFYLLENPTLGDDKSEFGESEASEIERQSHEVTHSFEDSSPSERLEKSLSSVSSSIAEDLAQLRPGWPLLRTSSSLPSPEARKMSVVQWVMSLPRRSSPETPRSPADVGSNKTENTAGRESSSFAEKNDKNITSKSGEPQESLELLRKANSSGCKVFSHDVLNSLTSQFSSEYLIGRGGCNSVYKGILPDGKPVAVKVLKSSKEAWKDFTQEVNIMTSLNHKNITPLLGICTEENDLISVYDYMSKGNLEENLRGNKKEKSVLSWEVRFSVAVGIADALNYLHNECSQPVIHRDVKSSNILLSDDYQPKLADFGLAIWGPSTSSSTTHSDVVGTFGYLAPEYFMYGKVSDKVDVYSFGVVLLELLSGKKSIGFETPKGQESLVMWAKPKLETGDLASILDPNLDTKVDKLQMQRMAVAATLCLTQAARLRPKMSQILQVLRGEKDLDEEANTKSGDQNDSENQDNNDDEVYPDSSAESHLNLIFLDVDDDSMSFSSVEQSSLYLEEYLKGRWNRSQSLE
ncbi:hypothetical protein RJ639_020062 [Escallonia herrerae]|uniref:Protein kinase domain-containing protein n=1 Tax=Escallonia herrerae TaxID=1293975 RepID=A0AA88V9M5_9ASTE|nr:hypothetical protein RJ639_020062 [Escallonia herrerae]